MMSTQNKKRIIIIGGIVIAITLMVCIVLFISSRFNVFPQIIANTTASSEKLPFPSIDESQLSEEQKSVIAVLKTEYNLNPEGTKYSEGITEAWCADFVSWVYKEAGLPLKNPHSGSWRIPGTYTLREYYESIGKLELADSNYSPKVGDIMLYDNPSPFGQHTNFVIKNDNGVITTIGGNEPGGIRIVEHTIKDGAGFIGYGVL